MSEAPSEGRTGRTPPYVSWKTVKTLLQDLHEHGVPSRIDRSVLSRFSGTVGTQLLTTFRFLEFIEGENVPTERLRQLTKSIGSDEWPIQMGDVIRHAYAPIFALDLETATPSHFNETFRKAFPGSDAVLAKCQTFFQQSCQDVGIKIGTRLLKGKRGQTTSGSPPRKTTPKRTSASSVSDQPKRDVPAGGTTPADTNHAFERELLAKFPPFDPSWPDELKSQWFSGFQQFMGMAKGHPTKE